MTFVDTSLIAIDGFGKELDSMHLFWIDGSQVLQDFRGRMKAVDPLVSRCHLTKDEAADYFAGKPSVVADRSADFNDRLKNLLEVGRSYIIEVSEW